MKQIAKVVNGLQAINDDELDLLSISLPPGTGKALAFDTPVLTRCGWKKHGDLTIRDEVISPSGEFVKILAIHSECEMEYEITFSNGEKVQCHGNHEWQVFNKHKNRIETLETRAMIGTYENDIIGRGHRYFYLLPNKQLIKGEDKENLPVDPYTLGVWLGDGANRNPTICNTKTDKSIIDRIIKHGYTMAWDSVHKDTGVHYYGFKELRQQLQSVGMCHSRAKTPKHIPEEYFTSSIAQRLELLAGLLDTDGTLTADENKYAFSTAEEILRDDFIKLVSTFGWRCTISEYSPTISSSGIKAVRSHWRIGFNPTLYIPCELKRKQLLSFSKQRKISIESISPIEGAIGNCITVVGGMYCVGKTLLPTHNSTIGIFFLTWIMGKFPSQPNLASAHSDKLTRSFYDGVLSIVSDPEYLWSDVFPGLRICSTNSKDETIDLEKNKRFKTLTCRSIDGSLTGATRCEKILYADDLVSGVEQSMSKPRMDSLWEKYTNDLKSRKKQGCKEIHIATRWTVHDVIGRLERQYSDDPRALFISIPALDDNGESNFDYHGDVGFNTAYFMDMKNSLDDVSWRCLFQNEPIEREGLLYNENELRRYFDLPGSDYDKDGKCVSFDPPDAVLGICDTKDTGTDYEFLPIGYQYGSDYYITDCVYENISVGILDEMCADILVKHNVKMCQFESNSAGGRTADKVQEKVKLRGGHTHITKKFTTANKETKIIVNSPFIKEHFLFKDSTTYQPKSAYGRMVSALCSYTIRGKNNTDDVPDGMAQFSEFVQSLTSNTVSVFRRPF